jgi:hypothetical protein
MNRFFSSRSAAAAFVAAITTAGVAIAEPEPAVDVEIREPPPPRRILSIGLNPLPYVLGRLSADVILVPISHHALVLSPFYERATTARIYVFDDTGIATRLPEQKFSGFGLELGYRYYFDERGPRGFFLGPSFIIGWLTATAETGSQTPYRQYGGAADLGYQMLVGDRVSLSLGGGVQYIKTDKSIPPQQFSANLFANSRVLPRLLLSVGLAL